MSCFRGNKNGYTLIVLFYFLCKYIKHVQSSHKKYFSQVYMCIQSNATN